MFKIKLMLCLCILAGFTASAQVKIGDNPTTVNGGSLLELESSSKGFVPPRVALTSLSSTNPLPTGIITGTLVFNTATGVGSGVGLYYWNGTTWVAVGSGSVNSAWLLTGNSGVTSSNFIGSTNAADFVVKTANTDRIRILGATANAGWISMGTAGTPRSPVDMAGSYIDKNVLTIQNTSNSGYSSVDLFDNNGTLTGTFGYANAGASNTGIAGKDYFNSYNKDFLIMANANNPDIFIKGSNGFVGMGTLNPANKLTILGTDPLYLGGVQRITTYGTNDSLLTINNGVVKKYKASSLITRNLTDFWSTAGNTGNNGEFLGTTDNNSLRFRTNNIQRMILDSTGDLGIGMANPPNALSVMATNPLYLSGVQATATLAADSVLTINAGVVKKSPYAAFQNTAWSLTGNSGTSYATNFLGTTDNTSLRFRTNNVQRMIIDSLGSIGMGSEAFGIANREKLLVDIGNTTSHTVATYTGSVNDYLQINIQNKNAGNLASADYVATANIGNDDALYVDMGINNSNYSPSVENWGGPLDAYMYANARNLLIGTQAGTADIIFLVGGGRINANTAMRITQGSSNVVIGNRDSTASPLGNVLRGPNANGAGNIAGGTLTIQGGASRGTAKGGALNLYGGGTGGTGRRGPINMLSDSVYMSGIPATTTVTSDSVLVISNTVVKKAPYSSFSGGGGGGSGWSLTGNSGTNPSTNFVGTTDFNGLSFRVNNTQAGFLGPSGSSYATSFGVNSSAVYQSTAIGAGAQATGSNASLAVGYQAQAANQNSIAIGSSAISNSDEAISIGLGANAAAYRGIAIGSAAKASGSTQNIAIGYNSNASSFNGIAIGYNSSATTNNNTMAVGVGATASGFISMALGNGAQATGQNSTAYGASSQAISSGANAFGNGSTASGTSSTAIGNNSTASGISSIVVGDNSLGSGAGSIALGNASTAGNSNTIVIGTNVASSQANALILGNSTNNVGIGTTTPNTSAKLDVNGNFKLGTTGTVLTGIFRTSVTLDPPAIAVGSTVTVTATVTGVSQNASVVVNPRSNLSNGVTIAWARASAANTITIGFTGTASLTDQPSAVYDVTIIQ